MENISSLLHEGGLLLMVEPNADYFLEKIRKIWYKFDKYFDASTEHALRHSQLVEIYGESWDVVDVKYLGGPAYFLILQSLILRIPSWLKRALSTPLFFLEKLYNKLPGVRPHPLFIARWRKK